MSISSFPRLFFKGEMASDPSLSNNPAMPDYRCAYDETNATIDRGDLVSTFPDGAPLDEIHKRLIELLVGSSNYCETAKRSSTSARK
jgi:hypothetical protein